MDTPVPTRWGDDECTDLPPPLAPHVEEVFSETGGGAGSSNETISVSHGTRGSPKEGKRGKARGAPKRSSTDFADKLKLNSEGQDVLLWLKLRYEFRALHAHTSPSCELR